MLWFALLTAASLAVYFLFIRPKLKEFRVIAGILDKIDEAGLSGWQKFKLRLLGQKTWLSGAIGVFVTVLPGALDNLHLVDFSAFFAEEVALKISGAIMLLMTVTHIFGIVRAAQIEPKKADE
ncbi:hypothetical protein Msil_3064 [Methylocella silvestris BL2]|uniref:Uncharacterized protein n=1 Tax=Methylocella silvestris (strain DSM 15510 / CIP 108128 / LMG 27833 / NCIMB 13906 / BL2) TaxID=395965 RepID=B8EKU6_METSB|nr:hypothetical protein [Methylocella silvestris]ACK51974.1 hypothetical protein Msil_3064 [Methylocella silvestris BL2]